MPVALVATVLLSIAAADSWRWEALKSPSDASLRGLSPIDEVTCWASGAEGTVLLTVDGRSWARLPIEGVEALDFRDVHGFDDRRAIVMSAGSPARFYRTIDRGETWTLVYENDHPGVFFDAMAFRDDDHGFAFSDPIDGRLLVIATDDGGRSWRELPRDSLPESPPGEAGFAASGTCLALAGKSQVWIGLGGTAGARVFRSGDDGQRWLAHDTPMRSGASGAGIFSIATIGAERAVAVGGDYTEPDGTAGNCAITADGGVTWEPVIDRPPTGYRSAVVALPETNGPTLIAVGPNGSDVSNDGGRSWRRFSDEGFHAVAVGRDGSVWASGSDGRTAWLNMFAPTVSRIASWSMFRGPNGTGVAASGTYPADIAPDHRVVWSRSFPEGHSSPALSGARVFLTGVEDERLYTYAVDRLSGETIWRREAPRPRRTEFHPKNHAAAASAAVDHDTVVVFFDEYGLLAYDHDGNERWRLPLGPFTNVYGMGASPIIVDQDVLLACDQAVDSFVIAVAKADGSVRWRRDRPDAVSGHCTPVMRRLADGRPEVIVVGSLQIDAYDVPTGRTNWFVTGVPSEMKSVPVLIRDQLWVHGYASPLNDQGRQLDLPDFPGALAAMDGDGDGRIAAAELDDDRLRELYQFLDLDADGSLDPSEWDKTRAFMSAVNSAMRIELADAAGDVTERVTWRYYRGIPQLPSPLIYDGVYYMLADQGGLLTLLDAASGDLLQKGRLDAAVDSYYASPVAGDGKVYLLSESGVLTVLAAGREMKTLQTVEFGEPSYATPALDDGFIYLRTHGWLYCFH